MKDKVKIGDIVSLIIGAEPRKQFIVNNIQNDGVNTIDENNKGNFLYYDTFEIIKQKESTPEQKAKELGFKIGDKFWDTKTKEYKGECKGFTILNNMLHLKFKDCSISNTWNYLALTNKVAIHCPTKEDFEFIYNRQLGRNKWEFTDEYDMVILNDDDITDKRFPAEIYKHHLFISIDDYCKSMDIKPLFVTEDKVNIYNSEQIVYIINSVKKLFTDIAKNFKEHGSFCKVFSTEQVAKEWLDKQIKYKGYEYECYDCVICCGCLKVEKVKCNTQRCKFLIEEEEILKLWDEHKELTRAMQYTKGEDQIRIKERLETLDGFLNLKKK